MTQNQMGNLVRKAAVCSSGRVCWVEDDKVFIAIRYGDRRPGIRVILHQTNANLIRQLAKFFEQEDWDSQ